MPKSKQLAHPAVVQFEAETVWHMVDNTYQAPDAACDLTDD